jgi:hypothetical protein
MPAKSIDIGARVKVTVPLGKGLSNRFVKDKDRRHQPKQLDQITTLTSNDEKHGRSGACSETFQQSVADRSPMCSTRPSAYKKAGR